MAGSSSEKDYAGPGLDVPAKGYRPRRGSGTPKDHPLNKRLAGDDTSLAPGGSAAGQHNKDMAATVIESPHGWEADQKKSVKF